ncbi:sodium-coupled monocarboxylate transporter 1 isoform X1 [Musca domestica]|uniref:Sodium-coupled monocarboxylate transporter 1 isoform X1 n=1 Tax=Musca domestica TaxID=7370 RepID=A0ABM3VFC5_MUSDO|nr:sodium-coupled monocarboxylate transporter 1 isoform X1 [Musca domestica]XP_058984474.1 sodium-coupled monocarboxylate transporter 1 isoform X1 [Musca domestica]XP_058984475.1 sodium-coupled monocarboxylate transporter 1 isoform X1 [Musca domestica]XP_058984476.1 sodium-coupled monocarboxylate transporter 1 isoform X1 [Musca domestica]XP_058984477.1 sodium-coupled monocarboxylate transporter 1 isoform X1 [Musca domestica]XP_058984478.1 sodium-coupled monocarboxylate transporter 1 isoform X1
MSSEPAGGQIITTTPSATIMASSQLAGSSTPSTTTTTSTTVAAEIVGSTVAGIKETMKTLITTPTARTTTTTSMATPSTTTISSVSSTAAISSSLANDPTKQSVADLSSSLQHFGIVDYCVFVLMLIICAAIGFYFGFIEKKQKKKGQKGSATEQRRGSEALDYLVGGRKMKVFPVSLSLVASFVSGISLLGTSTEIYVYGTQYAFILITLALSGVISWYVFLPVFCNLQLTSTYEYFEMRFGKGIRLFGSILFSLGTITWLPIVIYVPALAFNQVTGVNIHIITPVVCMVCIFYTCVGGLKAVVWTDVIQTVIMVGAIIFVIVKGTIDVGGLGVVWERNVATGRIEIPELTWDPTSRVSMLSILVGTTLWYTQVNCGNQVIVQRYLSVPSLKEAKVACIYFTVGIIIINVLTMYNGLLIFANYHDCDPLSTQLAKAKDQMVPLMVMETLKSLPGMAGLFVAGVFSAALSSLSTGLNSLAAVFLEDYIKPFKKTPLTERQTAWIMRLTVVIIGIISVALVLVIQFLGHAVIQLSTTLASVTGGPLLSLFLMGLLMPWINSKSAISGCIVAFVTMTWICIKCQIALATGELVYPEKPFSTEGCTYDFEPKMTPANATIIDTSSKTFAQYIYQMSFFFYAAVGCFISVAVAHLASCAFGRNDPATMNRQLFPPFVRKFIKSKEYQSVFDKEDEDETLVMVYDMQIKSDLKQSLKDDEVL